jgi:hypothetical protein
VVKITVIFRVGRRVPNSWLKRSAHKAAGFLSFQSNIWLIISQSLSLAKRKATESNKVKFVIMRENEQEDLNYKIEWIICMIQGTKEQEEEEYNDCQKFYAPLNKVFKKDIPKNEIMTKHFKTNKLTPAQVDEAYKAGYGTIDDNNLSNKLLELGILTYIEWNKDYEDRKANCEY